MTIGARPDDSRWMASALALARRGLGNAWPNPTVGCVLVRDGRVVGRGWTRPGGRPHAETEALAMAGEAARGADCYVTLEPCAHHGRTPPCAGAVIAAGVARVVVAMQDPDPRTDGGGIAMLREAGIAVLAGVGEAAARDVNAGFLSRQQRGRPLVTLKIASSLDGRIASAGGESRWITGPAARHAGHRLRAGHDAILVGAGTVLADDPALTCRLPGMLRRSPVRVVIDGAGCLHDGAAVFASAPTPPTWRFGATERAMQEGVETYTAPLTAEGHLDLAEVLAELGRRGINRVLVEGGAGLATGLLHGRLVDRIAWFRSPDALGGDGLAALGPLGVVLLEQRVRITRLAVVPLGPDLLETYVVQP